MDFLINEIKSDPYFFVRHHIDSFDSFVTSAIPVIVSKEDMTIPKERCVITVKFHDDVYIEPPRHTPNEARLNNYSYTSTIYVNVTVSVFDKATGQSSHEHHPKIKVGALPIMVHGRLCKLRGMDSDMLYAMGECPYDAGGYFIIDGKEKVFVTQERNVTNRLFVEELKDKKSYSFAASVRSTIDEETTLPKSLFLRVSTTTKDAIVVSVPRIKEGKDFPLFLLFRALGVESDAAILDHICDPQNAGMRDFLRASVVDGNDMYSQEAALAYLKEFVKYKTRESLVLVLLDDVLPNQGYSFPCKARALGYMVRKLVRTCMRELAPTDRDSYLNKRLSVTGELLSNEFKVIFRKFFNEAKSAIDNEYNVTHKNAYAFPFVVVDKINKTKIFQESILNEGLLKVLKGASAVKEELRAVQDLGRISYMSFLSHLRRVSASLDASAKIVEPHLLSGSHWGCVCPSESPDGASIGLLKNLAVAVRVTAGNRVKTADVLAALAAEFGEDLVRLDRLNVKILSTDSVTKVFVNDTWMGVVKAPDALQRIRKMRKDGAVHESVSVSFDGIANEISLYADDGRCCRPLKALEDNAIVYLDVEEINTGALIAMSDKDVVPGRHTHVEVHPATMFSVYTSTIPFANHNPGNRNTFSGAQGKQAIGLYATSFNNRIDTAAYVLHAPQRPLVATHLNAVLTRQKMHNGENVIVAIACYSGYNMEDSIILNKHSVERGLFNLTCYKNVFEREDDEAQNDDNHACTVISNPSVASATDGEFILRKGASYAKLDADGLPKLNSYINIGDAIVGLAAVENIQDANNGEAALLTKFGQKKKTRVRDVSHLADQNYTGYVDRVYSMEDANKTFCKVRIRRFRIPELGDKFASRHGQKGVIGSVMPAEMMPFNSDGLVPDLIVNPHAFPSRMTIGQLLETIGAKFCVTSGGGCVETTAFEEGEARQIERWGDDLQRRGYDRYGNDVLYNGITGEQIKTEIFIGPTYYFRLKHMVADKVNHRAEGAVISVTGQPTKGRSNGGGMRLGEMERDVLVSHGILGFQHESFTVRSDGQSALLADDGTLTYANVTNGIVGTRDQAVGAKRITPVTLPTAFKLLQQEVQMLHVDMKLRSELSDVLRWRRRP
jgi:DNA-directed RNA polymerase II subunit RPB2